ncbi:MULTISPECIES: DUF6268 family outer membrane beta-barrel protein [Maribacter]|uniref:DUF6268 domain-containing protein n=1 Tax=Maribacter luteus TaxID=2594478 RepID=A0A6I2MUM7_9FLAO|nr:MULTISPECIES: DUF6268 family outer membrane beta-barrel protein [Maribacter]MRX66174.1 hypothetical protein [Maribacter luteus]|tara:strand:+ start:1453 stop:2352 length:900 start_codon:yes stop_codon:yes gene_type:complete
MKMRKLVIIFILSAVGVGFSQETGSVYFNSEILPNSEVGTFKKNSVGFDFPIKNFSSKESISLIGEYQNLNIGYVDEDVPFETYQIDNFQTFSLGLLYNRILENGWGFSLKVAPQISSNFDEEELGNEDIFVNGSLVFDKLNEENNSMWSFGVEYDAQNGLNFPIPVVAYTKRIDDQWAYKIGFPDSRLKWSFRENHNFEAFTTLDGFAGNINDDIEIYREDYTGKLKNTYLVGGVGYNVTFLKAFVFNAKAGYSAFNTMEVQDYDSDEIYDFELENGLYYNFGLRYNFGKKAKVKSPY